MCECFTLLFPVPIKMQFTAGKKKTSTSACQCLSVLVCAVFCSRVLNGKGFDLSCFIYSLF